MQSPPHLVIRSLVPSGAASGLLSACVCVFWKKLSVREFCSEQMRFPLLCLWRALLLTLLPSVHTIIFPSQNGWGGREFKGLREEGGDVG